MGHILVTTLMHLRLLNRTPKGYNRAQWSKKCQKQWAQKVLAILKVNLEVKGNPDSGEACLFVGNHLSYLDILLLLSCSEASFVAKKEIQSWPLIGKACQRVGTLFVDRDNLGNRKKVTHQIVRKIKEEQKSVAIFPSGTTCLEESKPWKKGSFKLAKDYQFLIKPFRVTYNPLRVTAFIDADALLPHLYRLCGQKRIEATLEFHALVEVGDAHQSSTYWQNWTQKGLQSLSGERPA